MAKIFHLKKRPLGKPLPVLVPSADAARQIGEIPVEAEALIAAQWPGALTIVVARTETSRPWQLGGDGETIGLRVPARPFALELMAITGPLAATSANISGEGTPETVESIEELFGEDVRLYVDGGELSGSPSDVISFVGDIRKLR